MILTRFLYANDRTIGRIEHNGKAWWTVERPWKDNEPFISCIPEGDYPMVRVDSPRFGPDTWEIAEVPGREHILIHLGNWSSDVQGCIAIGTSLFANLEGVGSSSKAIKEFYAHTRETDQLMIRITSGCVSL